MKQIEASKYGRPHIPVKFHETEDKTGRPSKTR
jgi:hypothetical protein